MEADRWRRRRLKAVRSSRRMGSGSGVGARMNEVDGETKRHVVACVYERRAVSSFGFPVRSGRSSARLLGELFTVARARAALKTTPRE